MKNDNDLPATLPFPMVHIPRVNVQSGAIDVWRVHEPGADGGCMFDKESEAQEFQRNETDGDPDFVLEITKTQMTREAFEVLGEFNGF